MIHFYAPGRAGDNAETFLTGFDGILQTEEGQQTVWRAVCPTKGYTGYNRLTKPSRKGGAPIRVPHCWVHVRRKLKEVFDCDGTEIAAEGMRRIAETYAVEADTRGVAAGQRLSARRTRSASLVTVLVGRQVSVHVIHTADGRNALCISGLALTCCHSLAVETGGDRLIGPASCIL